MNIPDEIMQMYLNGEEVCATCFHAKAYKELKDCVICNQRKVKGFEADYSCDKWQPSFLFSLIHGDTDFQTADCCAVCENYAPDVVEDGYGDVHDIDEGYCSVREGTVDCYKVCKSFKKRK